LVVEGFTIAAVFEADVEQVLCPNFRSGQVVVMDTLTDHKRERVREPIEDRGREIVYLPPYPPNLNPIEEAFAKVKSSLKKFEARTREALVEAMGRALDAVTAREAHGFFEHCGYRVAG
jgi:transposase